MDTCYFAQYLDEISALGKRLVVEQADSIYRAGQAVAACLAHGGVVLLFGNGGSAANAQQVAAEFVCRFAQNRDPLPALALTTDTSVLTAICDGYGVEQIFAHQVRALGRPGDVAIAISTSGRSPNILAGVEAARERSIATIGVTGGDGGQLASIVDIPIIVPSTNVARIQECHLIIEHMICDIVGTLLPVDVLHPNAQRSNSCRKMVSWDMLLSLRERWRTEGKTVVWTSGCFDLLHVGHVRSLQAARSLGDVLVVGINSDGSVRQLKGPGRPVVPAPQRVEMLAALEAVDYVVVFDEATPETALSRLRPDVHCKGMEYAPPHGKPIPEAKVVESYGGRVEFLPMVPSTSTSELIRRIRAVHGETGERVELDV